MQDQITATIVEFNEGPCAERHEHTIGTITYGGHTYDIDWPFELLLTRQREASALYYLNGEELLEVPSMGFGITYTSIPEVLFHARLSIKEAENEARSRRLIL